MSINYIEKGYGLHAAIAEAGHSLYQVDGEWVADDPEAVQDIIDRYVPAVDVPNLNPAQFTYLLAITGLDSLWTDIESNLSQNNNRQLYAELKGSKARSVFGFEETLRLISVFTPYIPPEALPLLTRENLLPVWMAASDF